MLKLTFKMIKGTKLKSLMIIFGIAIGVALMISVAILNQNLNENLAEVLQNANGNSDMNISSEHGFTSDDIDTIKKLEYVEKVSVVAQYSYKNDQPECKYDSWLINGIDPEDDKEFREYSLAEGKLFGSGSDKREMLISKRNAEMLGVRVGSKVTLHYPMQDAEYTVVGILDDFGAGFANFFLSVYAPIDAVRNDLQIENFSNKVDMKIRNSDENYYTVYDAVHEAFGDSVTINNITSEFRQKQEDIASMKTGFNVLLIVVVLLCVFLIYNTYTVTIYSRIELIGLYRTIGIEKKHARRIMLSEALIYGITGSLIGVGLGLALGLLLLYFYGNYEEIGIFRVPLVLVICAGILGVLISVVSALIPTYKVCRIKPIESLRGESAAVRRRIPKWITVIRYILVAGCFIAPVTMGILFGRSVKGSAASLIMLLELIFFIVGFILFLPEVIWFGNKIVNGIYRIFFRHEATMVVRNMERNSARSTIVVTTFIVAIMMNVGLNGLFHNFRASVADFVDQTSKFDLYFEGNLRDYGDKNEIYEKISKIDGIQDYSGMRVLNTADLRINYWIRLLGIYPDEYLNIGNFDFIEGDESAVGELKKTKNGCLIGSYAAELYGVSAGDDVEVEISSEPHTLKVLAVVNSYVQDGRVIYLNNDYLTDITDEEYVDSVYLTLKNSDDSEQVMKSLKKVFDSDQTNFMSSKAVKEDWVTNIVKGTEIFDAIVLIVFVIGVLLLVNILTMSTIERQKEFGMIRACGADKKYIIKILLLECIGYFIVGAVFGLLSGFIFMYYGTVGMAGSMHLNVGMYMPYRQTGIVLLEIMIAAVLAVIIPAVIVLRSSILDNIRANKYT